jgi:prepilin-type N-terminal cleavage/methylation domain-containing protein
MVRIRFGEKRGFTLLEMMVVILISSIILLVLGVLAKSTFDVLRTGESRSQLNNSAQLAVDYIARDIESATAIPAMTDRNMNGVNDDDVNDFDIQAQWILGYEQGGQLILPTNYAMSEAFSDHLKLTHASQYRVGMRGSLISETLAPPKNLRIQGMRVANYDSYYRIAIDTINQPYYMSSYPFNNQYLQNYPQSVAIGYRDESAVLTQDLTVNYRAYENQGNANAGTEPTPGNYVYRFLNQPIGTNITRVRFEYFMEVPVYKVNSDGDAAYRNLDTGEVTFENAPAESTSSTRSTISEAVPIIDHYELRPVDICRNSVTNYLMSDQYTGGAGGNAGNYSTWNIDFYWNDPASQPDNPPPDHYAFTTDGEFRAIRYDTAYIQGSDNSSPTGWDAGNADGIPDGDGDPDDPVPTYWLPYVKAIRITVIATPNDVIKERRNSSGTTRNGMQVFYNADSPIPYQDPMRMVPLTSGRDLYIGDGKDLIVTRMVYPQKMFQLDLIVNPADARLMGNRRVDWNYFRGLDYSAIDPLDPDERIRPISPGGKYYEKDLR